MTDPPTSGTRFLLVVAAYASAAVQRRVRVVLDRLGERARVLSVRDVPDTMLRLRMLPGEIPVAAGGDGTANLLAQALRHTTERPILGLLPLGTGNALAHALGLGSLVRALAALEAGSPRRLDALVTTHPVARLALASLSAGFEGRFIARYARWRGRGRALAGGGAFLAEVGRTGDRIRLVADGQELSDGGARVYSAGLYNIPCYAGGRRVWPGADPGDGKGDAVLCPTSGSYWRAVAGRARAGEARDPDGPRMHRWTTAVLEATGPIQFDGESAPGGTLELRLEPGAVRVLVPLP